MKIPSNNEINRLCAEACGHHLCSGYGGQQTGISELPGGGGKVRPIPLYCEDRNALTELLQVLIDQCSRKQHGVFALALGYEGAEDDWIEVAPRALIFLLLFPPKRGAIAALRALGKWPEDDWSTEEPEKCLT